MNKNITMNFQDYLIEMPNPSTQGSSNETDSGWISVYIEKFTLFTFVDWLCYTLVQHCTKGGGSK